MPIQWLTRQSRQFVTVEDVKILRDIGKSFYHSTVHSKGCSHVARADFRRAILQHTDCKFAALSSGRIH